jgi:hypothetical protein
MAEKNLGASVRSKLKNKAQAENKEFNLILIRYALVTKQRLVNVD